MVIVIRITITLTLLKKTQTFGIFDLSEENLTYFERTIIL